MNNKNIWFSSDPHYFHKNIIKYCDRPFESASEMNEKMIRNWNSVVAPQDDVYLLGDFCFSGEEDAVKVAQRLNGNKRIIWGNHDKKLKRTALKNCFGWSGEYLELKVPDTGMERGEQMIVMCHYPMITWNKAHRGSWMLHGHCHNKLRYPFDAKILDVGVDGHNFTPISYAQVKAIMAKKGFTAVDHHDL